MDATSSAQDGKVTETVAILSKSWPSALRTMTAVGQVMIGHSTNFEGTLKLVTNLVIVQEANHLGSWG